MSHTVDVIDIKIKRVTTVENQTTSTVRSLYSVGFTLIITG